MADSWIDRFRANRELQQAETEQDEDEYPVGTEIAEQVGGMLNPATRALPIKNWLAKAAVSGATTGVGDAIRRQGTPTQSAKTVAADTAKDIFWEALKQLRDRWTNLQP
jgi:hypothetical protein